MSKIRNPFRQRMRRRHFDVVVRAYQNRHPDIIRPSGARCLGNSIAGYFWRGYDNSIPERAWDAASKEMMAYVSYAAGRAVAESEKAETGAKT